MASAQSSCTLCEEDSLNVPAICWCPECETFLCIDCDRHHKKIKASKHHTTVSVDAHHNLPDELKNGTNMCTDHAQKQEFYCPKHACACCLQCLNKKHSSCGEVKRLAEIVKNIKSSERVTSLEFNLECLKNDYDIILKHMRKRLDSVEADELDGLSKIQKMRSEVNRYMDIVEQTLISRLNTEREKIRTETTKAIEEIEGNQSNIDDTNKNLKAIIENATDLQVYTYLESLEAKTECELMKIEKLKKIRELDTIKIEVKISNGLAKLFNDIEKFGNVKITTSTSDLVFATGNTSVVQNATRVYSSDSSTVDESNSVPREIFQLFLRGVGGNLHTITIDSTASISNLFEKVHKKLGIPTDCVRLRYGAKDLKERGHGGEILTLRDYDIVQNGTLTLRIVVSSN